MEIKVGRKWRIKSTSTSWDVDHMEGKKGKEAWKTKYSCVDLQAAVQEFFEMKVRAIESSDADQIIKSMTRIKNDLVKRVPNLKLVVGP
jgi:hypothetical protein